MLHFLDLFLNSGGDIYEIMSEHFLNPKIWKHETPAKISIYSHCCLEDTIKTSDTFVIFLPIGSECTGTLANVNKINYSLKPLYSNKPVNVKFV